MSEDKIKERIKKLLALQVSATEIGSLEEAQNAAAQIRKLVMKYNIDLSEVEDDMNKSSIGCVRLILHEILPFNKTHGKWLQSLYHVVSKYNFGKSIAMGTTDPGKVIVEIWGEDYNVSVIKDLSFNYATQIINLEKHRWKTEGQYTGDKRNSYRRAYYMYAVQGLASTFYSQEAELKEEHGEQVTAIVKRTDLAIANEVEQAYGQLGRAKSTSNKSRHGAAAGFADGKNLKSRRPLNNGRLLN